MEGEASAWFERPAYAQRNSKTADKVGGAGNRAKAKDPTKAVQAKMPLFLKLIQQGKAAKEGS